MEVTCVRLLLLYICPSLSLPLFLCCLSKFVLFVIHAQQSNRNRSAAAAAKPIPWQYTPLAKQTPERATFDASENKKSREETKTATERMLWKKKLENRRKVKTIEPVAV